MDVVWVLGDVVVEGGGGEEADEMSNSDAVVWYTNGGD